MTCRIRIGSLHHSKVTAAAAAEGGGAAKAARGAKKVALFVGGPGLWLRDAQAATRAIAAATGCALLCENAFARIDRGAGAPAFERVPYFPADALKVG